MINWTLSVEDVACPVDDMEVAVTVSSSFVEREGGVCGEQGWGTLRPLRPLRVQIDGIYGVPTM